jgi:hypothetical protein
MIMNTSGHKSIDPILWDVAQFVINNGDEAFDDIQSTFGIDEERANALIGYLCIAGIATMTTFGPRANYFDEDALWERYSLLDFTYNKRTELKAISPKTNVLEVGRIVSTNAKIDGYDCVLLMYVEENELVGILRINNAGTIADENFASQFIEDNFRSYFAYPEPDALIKSFPVDFYDCAYDWYESVLTKFIELDETK